MRCPSCNKEMSCRRGEYHYTECGLDNVYLADVELWSCDCGESAVGIPAIPNMHKVIADDLLRKTDQLTGKEIRFLRKNIGISAKEFANRFGVTKETISRWETGNRKPDTSADRLIRLFYAAEMSIPARRIVEIFGLLSNEQHEAKKFTIPRDFWTRENDCDSGCTA